MAGWLFPHYARMQRRDYIRREILKTTTGFFDDGWKLWVLGKRELKLSALRRAVLRPSLAKRARLKRKGIIR